MSAIVSFTVNKPERSDKRGREERQQPNIPEQHTTRDVVEVVCFTIICTLFVVIVSWIDATSKSLWSSDLYQRSHYTFYILSTASHRKTYLEASGRTAHPTDVSAWKQFSNYFLDK